MAAALLCAAVKKANKEEVLRLIEKYDLDLNKCMLKVGRYPANILHYICTMDGYPLPSLHLLVELGVDIQRPSSTGMTPLYYACQKGKSMMMRYLISHGADPIMTPPPGLGRLEEYATNEKCKDILRDHRILRYLHMLMKKEPGWDRIPMDAGRIIASFIWY